MTIDVGRLDDDVVDPPAEDGAGQVAGLVELVEAQRATIESLRSAVDGHEASRRDRARARKAFAHEVATPLTAVLGLLELLTETDLGPDEVRALAERATRQAEHLRSTFEDFLDAPAEELVPIRRASMTVVAIADLVRDVVDGVSAGAGDPGIESEVPPGLHLVTVPSRVRQILTNLVVNARRHGGPGRVTISASRTTDTVVLDVADRGPGVSPAVVESLFEPFVQGPDADTRGVGLGLYLVRRLSGSLGGAVSLVRRPGGGTIARVVLPQQRDEDGAT